MKNKPKTVAISFLDPEEFCQIPGLENQFKNIEVIRVTDSSVLVEADEFKNDEWKRTRAYIAPSTQVIISQKPLDTKHKNSEDNIKYKKNNSMNNENQNTEGVAKRGRKAKQLNITVPTTETFTVADLKAANPTATQSDITNYIARQTKLGALERVGVVISETKRRGRKPVVFKLK